ncbi:RIIA lysis inhibitor [Aeromonas phage GomatiRiver_11]|nr:protein rIIA [Aeromonas phage AhFM11]WKW84237.1 RIIA lysis inhibitor [Aeromonas phage GomatiRiver_11]
MIIGSNEQDVMFGNAPKKRTGFKIQTGRKAFQVLSEKLYKDKAEAVLRELSCNAVDIHCELGKGDVPFHVTLPTAIYPWFVIRDFGSGLSQDQIDEIFTVYFASTKDNSDDAIGGFGLGCKSPFAYSESGGGFTVKSYQNGMCTVYNMYMDDGEPFATPMSTTPTDEENGLEILVPIPDHEHARWKVLAKKVFRAFDRCKPYITNMDASQIDTFPDEEEFFHADDFGNSGEVYAVIGGVVYPIPQRLLEGSMVFRYAGRPAYIKCPIGSVDIAPSREELSLTKEGEEYLIERMKNFSAQFANTIKKEFAGITNERQAVIKAQSYNSYVINSISDLEINGVPIQTLINRYTNMTDLSGYTVYAYRNGSLKMHETKCGYSWRQRNIDAKNVFGIHRTHVHVLICDTTDGVLNTVRAYHHHIGDNPPTVVINKHGWLSKSKYAIFGKNMANICEKFQPGERTILKFSEMGEILKEFKLHKRKTAVPKDAKPNVYRYYIDETDCIERDALVMTPAEIRELEGIGIISYGDLFDRIALKPSNSMRRSVVSKLTTLGAKEVFVIENGKRNPAVKAPKLKCGFLWAYEQYAKAFTEFDVLSGECPLISEYDEAIRLKKMGLFDFEITTNFDTNNDDFLADAAQWVEAGNPDFADFEDLKQSIDDANSKYASEFDEYMQNVKTKHPLLFAVAESSITLTDEILEDIKNIRAQ